jgi:hypothetical protein
MLMDARIRNLTPRSLPMITITTGLLAIILLALTLQDAFEVMLLPRAVQRQVRLVRYYYRASWAAWRAIARRLPAGHKREHFLGVYGALSMVTLFAAWASSLIVGFGMLFWALRAETQTTLANQLYMSGVTFFTLGYGDMVPQSGFSRLLAVIEGGTGFGFIAVVIGYLPVLYQLFSRREAHVILLDARTGTPPTALGLFWRHPGQDGAVQINTLLRSWEIWGAELLESHLSYPMLAYYRAQHENQSWLGVLAVIMDACALLLVGRHAASPIQARMTFMMARQILTQMAQSFGLAPSRYTGGDRLDHAGFLQLKGNLAAAGLELDDDVEEILAALRATYEPLLDGLAVYLMLPLPNWSASGGARDHWTRGPRGTLARRLVEELSEQDGGDIRTGTAFSNANRWRRLRARLRPD